MLKSVTAKLAGIGAAVVATAAIATAPAGAFISPPCYKTGPQITVSGNSGAPLGTVHGTCFTTHDTVDIWFWGNGLIVGESRTVESGGTFSAPVEYVGTNGSESVEAFDFTAGTHSNTVTFPEPVIG
jgi:hypothetical protein